MPDNNGKMPYGDEGDVFGSWKLISLRCCDDHLPFVFGNVDYVDSQGYDVGLFRTMNNPWKIVKIA